MSVQPLTCIVCEKPCLRLVDEWVRPSEEGLIYGLHRHCANRVGTDVRVEWKDDRPVVTRPKPRCTLVLASGERVTVEGRFEDLCAWHKRRDQVPSHLERQIRPRATWQAVRRFQSRGTYSGDPTVSIDARHVAAIIPSGP